MLCITAVLGSCGFPPRPLPHDRVLLCSPGWLENLCTFLEFALPPPTSSLPPPLRVGVTDVCHPSHYLFSVVMNGKYVNLVCILLHLRMNSSEHFLIWKCFVFLMEIKSNRSWINLSNVFYALHTLYFLRACVWKQVGIATWILTFELQYGRFEPPDRRNA